MIRKLLFRFLMIICIIVIGIFGFSWYTYQQSIQEKEARRKEAELEKMKEEEEIAKNVEHAKKMVESISNEIQFVTLRESGSYILYHDKTPENKVLTEWLINSEIEVSMNYEAIFTIDADRIKITILEDGGVKIQYDLKDISISSIEISNIIPTETTSLFGEKYSATEIAALEKIATERIKEACLTNENIEQASLNLQNYFRKLALSFEVEKIVIESLN